MTKEQLLTKNFIDFYKEILKEDSNPFLSVSEEILKKTDLIQKYVNRYFGTSSNPKNNLEKQEILSQNIVSTIDIIISKYPNIVFGGSVVLNALGIIQRPIKDLDLFIKACEYSDVTNVFNNLSGNITRIPSETITDVNGDLISRFGWRINGTDVCIFLMPESKEGSLQSTPFEFLGRSIQIQNVNEAILAKKAYSKMDKPSCDKHREDMKNVENFFDNLL